MHEGLKIRPADDMDTPSPAHASSHQARATRQRVNIAKELPGAVASDRLQANSRHLLNCDLSLEDHDELVHRLALVD